MTSTIITTICSLLLALIAALAASWLRDWMRAASRRAVTRNSPLDASEPVTWHTEPAPPVTRASQLWRDVDEALRKVERRNEEIEWQ